MANEGNGGYMNYGDESDFKRKVDPKKDIPLSDEEEEHDAEGSDRKMSGKPNDYFIKELLSERVQIDGKYPHADRLLEQELNNARDNGKLPGKDSRYVDIYREKPIKVTVKVIIPVKEHPKFNFVGKLLGPKGNSMRRLQEDTLCKMAVMGRGSMKDRGREDSLRNGLDPKYAHLNDDLHVEISALAPPAEAHARIAYALAEVRKYLIPDSNDEIRQEQFRELVADGVLPGDSDDYPPPPSSTYSKRPPPTSSILHRSRSPSRSVMPAKQKVLSILDRARTATIDSRYSERFSEPADYDAPPYHELERHQRPRTRPVDHPPMEYRRDYYRDPSPTYVKPIPAERYRPSASSSSWRGAPGGGYLAASRAHPEDVEYPRHHQRVSERTYRGSPYLRHPK